MSKIAKGAWMKLGAPVKSDQESATKFNVVYQLKVSLLGSRPLIWRRFLVGGGTTLDKLHLIVQKVMGWKNSHSHVFEVDNKTYADLKAGHADVKDECRLRLGRAAPLPKCRLRYEYDLGDCWLHEILVEKIMLPKRDQLLPICIAGRGACPPEDCGGLWGYYAMLDSAADPEHPDHVQMQQWLGARFNPDAFDFESVDARLKALQCRR